MLENVHLLTISTSRFISKFFECFSKYIPSHIKPNILNDEDIDIVFEEIVNNKGFEKSDAEIETYESIEEIKYPQEYDN